ncbi:MAG: hypothetical protein GY922_04830, partial [Proteobacteria bacterium]|nr:hypothetical protein [Pseudomonadota bacterium]
MAEDKDKKKGDKSANQYLVEASEGKFLGAQTGLLSGDTLRTAVDLHTGILAGTLKVNSFGLVDMESTGETRRRLKGKKRDSGGLKDGGIGALKEEQARRLGLLSAADFATNDQCILLEMAKKIYDYAVTPGTPEILSAPPITSAHQGMAALDPTLQEMMTGGAAIKSPKIGLAIPATAAIKSITQLGTIYKNNYDVIRGITLHRKSTRFLEITPAQVAQLSPLIYLSVDYYDKSGNRARRIPLDFPNKAMLKENILQSSGQRFGGGIKDITITHEGIDSATEKIVLIDSTFIFQDFRTASQGNYEELLKIGTRGSDSNLRRYINFEFGWDSNGKTRARHGGLALETMRSHVRGELVKYTFDFAEDGSIVLKTQHRGHLHTIFGDSPAANLLSAQKAAEEGLRAQSVQIINANKSKLLRDNKNSLRENRLQQLAAKVAHRALEKSHITGLARRVSTSTLSLDTSATTEEMLAQFAGAAPSTDIEAGLKTPTALLTQDEINMVNSRAKSLLKSAYYAHTQNQGTGGGAVEGETLQVTHTQMDATMRELRKATHNVKVQNDALQQNLKAKNIHNFAAAQFQKKVGLLRFTTLFNLATSLSEKQKVYYGGIDSEKRIQIASALAYQPTLQQAFGGLTAQSFLTHPRQIGGDSTFQNMLQNKGAAGSEMAIATALTKMTTFPFVFLGDFLQTILDTPATLGTKSGTMFELMKETAGVDIE